MHPVIRTSVEWLSDCRLGQTSVFAAMRVSPVTEPATGTRGRPQRLAIDLVTLVPWRDPLVKP
jgi:hypothetical protein